MEPEDEMTIRVLSVLLPYLDLQSLLVVRTACKGFLAHPTALEQVKRLVMKSVDEFANEPVWNFSESFTEWREINQTDRRRERTTSLYSQSSVCPSHRAKFCQCRDFTDSLSDLSLFHRWNRVAGEAGATLCLCAARDRSQLLKS